MPNRLAHETSPYLLQHADNPVDWHPWDAQALALARATDRPILLSIGYSACHWCHVMAHECFEDAQTAALMNRHFVNVKVDREERPDLDQVYQSAHQAIAGRAGGWPLTMFLTPEGKPFFGGTYFPKRPRHGLPGFDMLLERVAEAWRTRRAELEADGDELVRLLADAVPRARHDVARHDAAQDRAARDGAARDAATRDDAARRSAATSQGQRQGQDEGCPHAGAAVDDRQDTVRHVAAFREATMRAFDTRHGGFGRAPKFPQPSRLEALLRIAVQTHDAAARDAVLLTLQRMAEGGLYDHLGGGFFRYSTDARWLIPHFEKMLYDNGPLLRLYAVAWRLTGEPLFRRICEGTAAWMMREMQSPEGGYHSSLDADSEGEEGRFYVWRREEVEAVLDPLDFAAFALRHGLDEPPNFESRAWHLHLARSLPQVAALLGRDEAECEESIERARALLAAHRDTRARPGLDDKVLASWNALAIEGMSVASRLLERPDWGDSARRALEFVRRELWQGGRLLATHRRGRSHLNAYLDDHAYLLGALLEIMQAGRLRAEDVRLAQDLADALIDRFEDRADGGFHFTSHDHEPLVLRPKSGHDGATPSGNGMAALHLQRLGHLLSEPRYLRAAERTLALFAPELAETPQAYPTLLSALIEQDEPPATALLTGPPGTLAPWRAALRGAWRPDLVVLELPAKTGQPAGSPTGPLPAALDRPDSDAPRAWLCHGTRCLPPIDAIELLIEALERD